MSEHSKIRDAQSNADFFNRIEMRRRFAFLDDTWAQWREDLEGHVGIGLLALPIFLCFLLLGMLLALPQYAADQSLVHWWLHWALDLLLVLLYLPIGPILVGVSRYFLVHQRLRQRTANHAPTALQTFTQPHTVDAAHWAERPGFGLVVSGFRPMGPGLIALVTLFLLAVVPSAILSGLGVWLGMHVHWLFAVPLYLCALLVYVGMLTLHLYSFHFIAEAGLPPGEAMKASRQAVKEDPLLAVGTLMLMVMVCGLGFLLCGVGLLAAIPGAWLILTRAYLTLPDRPADMALNEFDPPAAPMAPASAEQPPTPAPVDPAPPADATAGAPPNPSVPSASDASSTAPGA